jgi:phosphoribosylamine--glycine ligase
VDGRLSKPSFREAATVCVYMVPTGYPTSPKGGTLVDIDPPKNSELFYASVHEENGAVYTTTSRSVALLARGATVAEARKRVYEDIPKIKGDLVYRRDIAATV